MIRRQGGGARETFTVRKISYGVGVERTFPVHTPAIEQIEVVTRGQVRRAKLYYLRSLRGKAARIKERREPAASRLLQGPGGIPVRRRCDAVAPLSSVRVLSLHGRREGCSPACQRLG